MQRNYAGWLRPTVIAGAVLMACGACGSQSGAPQTTHASSPTVGTPAGPPANLPGPPSAPALVALLRAREALDQMASHAYNPAAPPASNVDSGVRGGLYVNWRPGWNGLSSAGANTDVGTDGQADATAGKAARHDPLTDLAYLRDLYRYKRLEQGSTRFDRQIAQMSPIVHAEFDAYGYYRGWVYFELVDLAADDPAGGWLRAAQNLAGAIATHFWDPVVRAIDVPRRGTYDTDLAAESAAALVDAGSRFEHPQWSAQGIEAADHLLGAADPQTGLFPLRLQVGPVKDLVVNDQVTIGVEAQALEALLTVYDHTRETSLVAAVDKATRSLYSSSLGIYDTRYGGFFFSVNADGTGLRTAYKETRQAWMVPFLQHLQRDVGGQTAHVGAAVKVVLDSLWQARSQGYAYRVAPNFGPFTDDHGPGRTLNVEDYVSTEAVGIAVHALEDVAGPAPSAAKPH